MKQLQRDLLAVLGVWLAVDGTGAFLYVYPFFLWQCIRLVRVFIGISLIGIAFFSERRKS